MTHPDPHRVATAATRWHAMLTDAKARDSRALALLRRARNPLDVALVPAYAELLRACDVHIEHHTRLSLIAAALGHVKQHDSGASLPRQLAGTSDAPIMNARRFQRLLQTPDEWSSLHIQATRAIQLLGGRANVADLAGSLVAWTPETRERWALEYYDIVNERSL